ncbi:MAG: hypothetical protein ABID45_02055 [Patescibacteria group bacterium]
MKKFILLVPLMAILVFAGATCTTEDTKTVTVSNTAIKESTIKLDNTVYEPGGDMTVTLDILATENLKSGAWVGIIPSDVTHGSEEVNDENDISYAYVSSAVNDQLSLVAPLEAGKYDVRLNDDDGTDASEITYVSFEVIEE